MRKRVSVILAVEIFVVFLVVTLLGSFLLYPTVLDRLETRFQEENRARARVIVTAISDYCIEPILDGDDLVLGLIIAKAAKDYGGMNWIGITDAEGETIAHTDLKFVGKRTTLPPGIVPETDGDFVSGFYGGNGDMLWAAYPITIGESRRGTVHVGMSVDSDVFLQAQQALRRKSILIYAGLGALSALLIVLLSYRPIGNLTLAKPKAVNIAAGKPEEKDFEERIARKREEEAELSERISRMRNKEKELVAQIKTLKKEAEISERRGEVETAPEFVTEKEKVGSKGQSPPPEEVETAPGVVREKGGTPPAEPISVKDKVEAAPQFAMEKEKIEAIRKRIHELERRMRGK